MSAHFSRRPIFVMSPCLPIPVSWGAQIQSVSMVPSGKGVFLVILLSVGADCYFQQSGKPARLPAHMKLRRIAVQKFP
ncbi:hypothetical protein FF011L_46430 [Roseimaritima multifibrata]|uniref:Uncharacterized protein n=1 Tax=Roseimaritima multifibrata TaxID=1930274 RepID=A0A517MLT2_9BACT|nr:hypothetical protein FF011L_46430 [Roseimaritima multifibrata]